MAPGGAAATLLSGGGAGGPPCTVAVQVSWKEFAWHVEIRHGLRVVNRHQASVRVLSHNARGGYSCSALGAGQVLDLPLDGRPLRMGMGGQGAWTRQVSVGSGEPEDVQVS